MKPETAAYLANAAQALKDAGAILAIQIPLQAARLAYYAQFHAAQALIFERTGKIAKTHRGVKAQFHKEATDYETGSEYAISAEDAAEAIHVAERFVATVRRALSAKNLRSSSARSR